MTHTFNYFKKDKQQQRCFSVAAAIFVVTISAHVWRLNVSTSSAQTPQEAPPPKESTSWSFTYLQTSAHVKVFSILLVATGESSTSSCNAHLSFATRMPLTPPPPRRPIDGPATVNLHCAYVTFLKRRRPRSQVINPAQGNWMLIGETIDHKPAWIVRSNIDDSSHIDKRPRRMRARETIATRPHPFIIVMIGLRRQRVLSAWLNVLVQCLLGGRIHLSFHFHSALASSHTATFTRSRGTMEGQFSTKQAVWAEKITSVCMFWWLKYIWSLHLLNRVVILLIWKQLLRFVLP